MKAYVHTKDNGTSMTSAHCHLETRAEMTCIQHTFISTDRELCVWFVGKDKY